MNRFGTHDVILIQITEEVQFKPQDNHNTLFLLFFKYFNI
jgi:hypothetical protein